MSYLVRKISRAKWDNEEFDFLNENNPPADAITSCLRTSSNELSTWQIDNLEDINKAVLCLITGSSLDKLNTMQIIYFDTNEVKKQGLKLEQTPGDTIIPQYKNSHYDIKNLTYNTLGNVKDLVLDCLRNDRYKCITKKELKELLNNAINQDNLFEKTQLNEKLQTQF